MSKCRFRSASHRAIIEISLALGFTVEPTKSGHLKHTHAGAGVIVYTSGNPRAEGDHKPFQKLRTALRRAGETIQ